MARVLGIETSCDERAVAVLSGEGKILSNVVDSQVEVHAHFFFQAEDGIRGRFM